LSVAQCAVETNLSKLSRVRIERPELRSSDADGGLILVARDNNNKKYSRTSMMIGLNLIGESMTKIESLWMLATNDVLGEA
jgi:hypothetical protein